MDLTFNVGNDIFNYRVCAVIMHNGRLLAMKNDKTPYYFLPGGRVMLHESADKALLRELKEELDVEAQIVRPLWFVQSFFLEDTTNQKFHELCVYYLADISDSDLINQNNFTVRNSAHNEIFYWIDIDGITNQYLYPLFIKEKINKLPVHFEILTEYEY